MGRSIKRVPMDFTFPIGSSYHEAVWEQHCATCKADHRAIDNECEWGGEPPKGEGWQLWQTVSDGPISPVFATPDELIDWMCLPVPLAQRPHYEPLAYPPNPWAQGWCREVADPFVRRALSCLSGIAIGGALVNAAEYVVRGR